MDQTSGQGRASSMGPTAEKVLGAVLFVAAVLGMYYFSKGMYYFSKSKSDKTKHLSGQRQGQFQINPGPVSEMAEAFTRAGTDITGRQRAPQRVTDE